MANLDPTAAAASSSSSSSSSAPCHEDSNPTSSSTTTTTVVPSSTVVTRRSNDEDATSDEICPHTNTNHSHDSNDVDCQQELLDKSNNSSISTSENSSCSNKSENNVQIIDTNTNGGSDSSNNNSVCSQQSSDPSSSSSLLQSSSSSSDPTSTNQGISSNSNNLSSPNNGSNGGTIEDMETVERLEKYSSSEIIFHRQVASRSILETFHEVRGNTNDLQRVAAVVSRFASDSEPSIRAELAEQLPQIACFCLNPANGIPTTMSNITLPIIEQFLSDSNSQVRKITQNSLCFMLEQNIIDLIFIEDKISPILVHLMDISNLDDFRIEAVTTVSKIVRFLGKEITERIFLTHYSHLCSDVSFHVRRVCASNIGELATVIGQSLTESILLPQFKNLCEDGIWGVRKACADVFVPVSCVCSNQVRRDILGPLFVGLLCDNSKWVKTAAFQALGPFISTFADPRKTGLYYNDGGVCVVGTSTIKITPMVNGTSDQIDGHNDNNGDSTKVTSDVRTITIEDNHTSDTEMQVDDIVDTSSSSSSSSCPRIIVSNSDNDCESMDIVDSSKSVTMMVNGHTDSAAFNTFQFWRVPIPDLKPVLNYVGPSGNRQPVVRWEMNQDFDEPDTCSFSRPPLSSRTSTVLGGSSDDSFTDSVMANLTFDIPPIDTIQNCNNNPNSINNCIKMELIQKQDTIPVELLEHYLNMTSPSNYDSIDNDLTHHCAFSLPAVAMTLGRKHWPCLRDTFECLTVDMQWKVRWTLASSLHQMAQILGPEYTSTDLLPAFVSFMKDLDEVRFGVLQNLSSILKILNRPEQLAILPKITEFMKLDNPRNWRFRSTLAQQVNAVVHLYHPLDIKEYLLPVAFALLRDKVSEVRIASIKLLSSIMHHFYNVESFTLGSICPLVTDKDKAESNRVNLECLLISELTSLVDSTKWIYRQVFVFLVEQMITDKSLPIHIFNDHFLTPLLSLATDRVPNIRMALSRCLVRSIYGNDVFEGQQELILSVLHKFADDSDSDVKRFAGMIRREDKKVTINGFVSSEEDEQMVVDTATEGTVVVPNGRLSE